MQRRQQIIKLVRIVQRQRQFKANLAFRIRRADEGQLG